MMHHHGADGSCHPGPGGIFPCVICERDQESEEDDSDQDEVPPVLT